MKYFTQALRSRHDHAEKHTLQAYGAMGVNVHILDVVPPGDLAEAGPLGRLIISACKPVHM